MKQEIFYTDMHSIFEHNGCLSSTGEQGKWCTLPYQNEEFSGTLISSLNDTEQRTVEFDPKLCGWYKIYVGMPGKASSWSHIQLTKDIYPTRFYAYDANYFEEMFWRCEDMTGQSIILLEPAIFASLRFVPMSNEEIEAELLDRTRTDTRKLYVANDMNNTHGGWNSPRQWRDTVQWYEFTDAEWYSPEFTFDYHHRYRKTSKESVEYLHQARLEMVDQAHKQGLKVAHSNRMGAWGFCYPYNTSLKNYWMYEDVDVLAELDGCNCIDRSGEKLTAMSYAFPEVRKHKIRVFLDALRSGGEAINLLAMRGIPYVLFEKPVADRFFEKYGEYPYDRPLDDPELNELHCDIMTEYVRELKNAIDEVYGKDKIEIHLQALNSIADCKAIGFDVERLAREGLVQRFITSERRLVEFYPDEILKSKDPVRIDMDKFEEYFNSDELTLILDIDFNRTYTPTLSSKGDPVSPLTFGEMVKEWTEFEKKYGVVVYHELSEFCHSNKELTDGIKEMYGNGATHFSAFNTVCRIQTAPIWNVLKKVGHKDLMFYSDIYLNGYRKLRIHSIGECNYNRYSPEWLD